MKHTLFTSSVLAALCLTASLASAQTEQTAVRLKISETDLHPASPAQARLLLTRLENAALDACGASAFSAPEVKAATRQGECYRQSLTAAVSRIGDPKLAGALASEDHGQSLTPAYAGADGNVQ